MLTFWELTPFELKLTVDGVIKRMQNDYDHDVTMAYMTAYWTNQWQSKRKPDKLEKYLINKPEKRQMTDEEMYQKVQMLHKALGGE